MARVLLVTHDGQGNITCAGVHDIVNAGTYKQDGYLEYASDGLLRPVPPTLLALTPIQPQTHNVLQWWREGKYRVEGIAVAEVAGWTPPVLKLAAVAPNAGEGAPAKAKSAARGIGKAKA